MYPQPGQEDGILYPSTGSAREEDMAIAMSHLLVTLKFSFKNALLFYVVVNSLFKLKDELKFCNNVNIKYFVALAQFGFCCSSLFSIYC